MDFSTVSTIGQRKRADALVLPFLKGDKKKVVSCFDIKPLAAAVEIPLQAGDFSGAEGEVLIVYTEGKLEPRLILLGLGTTKTCDREALRRSYSALVHMCHKKRCSHLNLILPHLSHLSQKEIDEGIIEGILLTNYAFDMFKTSSEEKPASKMIEKICAIGAKKGFLDLCEKREKLISCTHYARDLVNGNADDVTPQALAEAARQLGKEKSSIKVTVFDKKRIEKEKMGLLLAVSRGAAHEPAFIILEYKGSTGGAAPVVIVGKGITYDTGGLNIKPTGSMETMKCDMSGAAAVLATLKAAALLKLKCNLVGIIATTENAIGPMSYKPGDVYRSLSGKTVEVANTDAEGRLILADALTYAQRHFKPRSLIDLATLTGGVVVALGEDITGLFSNDDTLSRHLEKAGEITQERLWRLPLYAPYKHMLKSKIADISNSGGRKASSITAALFLQEFIEKETAWAHLDIAGSAHLSEPKHYNPTIATGIGVRLLIAYLESCAIE